MASTVPSLITALPLESFVILASLYWAWSCSAIEGGEEFCAAATEHASAAAADQPRILNACCVL